MFSSSRSNASMAQANSHTLRALGALLAYPDAPLRGHLLELRELLRAQGTLSPSRMAEIEALIASIAHADPLDAEADYVELFDRGRRTSLHLFEHVHGESRDRGQAMVDLLKLYQENGYTPVATELPDFLPLFLEYASTRPPAEAVALVGQPANVLAALAERLAKRQSAYGAVMT